MEYLGIKLVNIPSGLGGTLPAALTGHEHDGQVTVICLHDEFYPNWVLTVAAADIKPWTWGEPDARMKRIIASRKGGP